MEESSPEAREIRREPSALVHRARWAGTRGPRVGQAADSDVPDVPDVAGAELDDEPEESEAEEPEPSLLPEEVEEPEEVEALFADRLSVR